MKEKGAGSAQRRRTHTYLSKGRRPRRAKNLGFVFNPLPLSHSVLSLISPNVVFCYGVSTSMGDARRKSLAKLFCEN